jgi:hypothetical protein
MNTVPVSRSDEDATLVRARLRDARELFASAHTVPAFVRPVVAGSWRRSARAGVGVDGHRLPPVRMSDAELADYRSRHPLAVVLPVFRSLLGESAGDGKHVFAIGDADGMLLWVQGHAGVLGRAERMNFVEGAVWSESRAGTNAPGTALAVGQPVHVLGAEHYNEAAYPWSCAAVPIRDPADGRILGVVDITGGVGVASPHALALVRATARAAEAELARIVPSGRRVEGVRLRALGRDSALLEVDGHVQALSPRHSEIVAILALARGGRSADRLAVELSEVELGISTVRAEMSRLRAVLGDGLLDSRPYALRRPVTADFLDVGELLACGRVQEAMTAYAGPLLPSSLAPVVEEHRTALEQQVRGAVLASDDVGLLRRWVSTESGAEDAVAWQVLAAHLPRGSVTHGAAAGRAHGLSDLFAASSQRLRSVGASSVGCGTTGKSREERRR